MTKFRNTIQVVLFIALLSIFNNFAFAQENHIQFHVINDTAHVDSEIPVDSLGNLMNIEEDEELFDNVDHGNGMLFTYFNWMPGYNLYQNFDIITIHYRHQGSAPRDTISLEGYHHPANFKKTSDYGWRGRRMHRGVDLGYPTGTPVAAAWDGIVRISKGNNTGGYGNLVVIRHNNGLETYYAHLSRRLVNPGQIVKAGDIIGLGGNTGRSYGSHLHFEIRYLGMDLNPNRLVDFDNFQLKFDTMYVAGYSVSTPNPTPEQLQQQAQPAPKPKPAAVYYKVRKGDNLGRIAQKYHTTVSKIKKLNHLRSDFIRDGQRLRVK
ncbi:MAG: peptidoglycan DD-metalloendopeptidase family protein [Bacteroidales bacterium]|nr:peptidoglycan DD-metalloendopeptidase family protein [Bacteroidales bacterium]